MDGFYQDAHTVILCRAGGYPDKTHELSVCVRFVHICGQPAGVRRAYAKRGNAEPLTAPAKKFRIACGRAVGNVMTYYRGYACRVCVEADARKPGARLLGTERIKFRFAHCCCGAACKLKKVVARSFYPD